ncbi:unnamed protein product [Linum trigynum]|uniref:Uncharacterized protein n=1 Tax=Linum trigynum TaxID=586398 RepID=A0AAV2CUG5_9ROSI
MESPKVRAWALACLPMEYHQASKHGDNIGAHLKVVGSNLRVLDGGPHVFGSSSPVVSHGMLIRDSLPAIIGFTHVVLLVDVQFSKSFLHS